MSIAALIPTAGLSRRMGAFKPLLQIAGKAMLSPVKLQGMVTPARLTAMRMNICVEADEVCVPMNQLFSQLSPRQGGGLRTFAQVCTLLIGTYTNESIGKCRPSG